MDSEYFGDVIWIILAVHICYQEQNLVDQI